MTVAKQRLVAIEVGEVSMVDHPANEEEFVVTKALAANHQLAVEALITKAQLVMLHPSVAMYATMDALRDSMYALIDKLRDPDKLLDATAEVERIKTMLDSATTLAATVTKASTDFLGAVTKAKEEAPADPKGGKKKMPPWMKAQMKSLIETLKAMDDEDEPPAEETPEAKTQKAIEAVPMGTIEVLAGDVVVIKGGKAQFSKDRMTKLKEAAGHLMGMMKDADGPGFDAFVKGLMPAQATATVTETTKEAPATTAAPAAPVSPEAPPWFATAIEGLKKNIDDKFVDVTKRVENIEKVEAVSKALPQGTDKPVTKAESLWKNVL